MPRSKNRLKRSKVRIYACNRPLICLEINRNCMGSKRNATTNQSWLNRKIKLLLALRKRLRSKNRNTMICVRSSWITELTSESSARKSRKIKLMPSRPNIMPKEASLIQKLIKIIIATISMLIWESIGKISSQINLLKNWKMMMTFLK
jgi:hypothetical protein